MIGPFFALAMTSPSRQLKFRQLTIVHLLCVAAMVLVSQVAKTTTTLTSIGYLSLVLGLVEGAAVIGWRLTQLPKSQSLEFLLASPIQPRRVFLAEASVGISRFLFIQLAGLPLWLLACQFGPFRPFDILTLFVMPMAWGPVVALLLTAWVYEPILVRRLGELIGLIGVVIYLTIGVLAAENLRNWLTALPPTLGQFIFNAVALFHDFNPFGIVRYWFEPLSSTSLAIERFQSLHLVAAFLFLAAGVRAACRLSGHFHELHYRSRESQRPDETHKIREAPLTWWARKRVMQYSGRVNLWLAGGFAILYAAFLIAGDHWPAWMGRLVFALFEQWGGAATVATSLAVLAAVPAVFQFGLWDANVQDRAKRLELLLLSDLEAKDYRAAALSAAWKRGRGYLVFAALLWFALAFSGRCSVSAALVSAFGAGLLWAFSFAFGFRCFARGNQTNGYASLLTLGSPILLFAMTKYGLGTLAIFIPVALVDQPVRVGLSLGTAASFGLWLLVTIIMLKKGIKTGDADLRKWYDENSGRKSVE